MLVFVDECHQRTLDYLRTGLNVQALKIPQIFSQYLAALRIIILTTSLFFAFQGRKIRNLHCSIAHEKKQLEMVGGFYALHTIEGLSCNAHKV